MKASKLVMSFAAVLLAAPVLSGAQSGPAQVRDELQKAIASGNVAAAVSLYADNAAIDGIGLCTKAPCVGKEAIQKEIERRVRAKNTPKTLAHYVSGDVLTTRVELASDGIRKAGVERIVFWLIYEVKNGKIVSERGQLNERTDAQTARFFDYLEKNPPK